MPQLNSATFISQMFWLVISFMLMWLVVGVFIVPKINDVMKRRQRKIDDYVAGAENFRQSAQELIDKYDSVIKQAEKDIEKYRERAGNSLQEQKKKMQAEEKEQINKIVSDGRAYIESIRDSVKQQTGELSADLANAILIKLGINDMNIQNVAKEKRHGG